MVDKVKEPAGKGFAVVTILAILFFFAVVAVLIRSYDSGTDIAAAPPATIAPASGTAEAATGSTPIGGVATGGGGMAGDAAPVAPAVVVGLVTVTMLGAGAVVVRRREV